MTDAVDLMLQYHQNAGHYPGALVHVEQTGQVLCRRVFGVMSGAPDAQPMHDQARFRIASLTKPMVSFVVLMLVDEGRISLDTPVAQVLPELADLTVNGYGIASTQPTIGHLLTHTSGIAYAPEIRDPALREQALAAGLGNMASLSRADFLAALGQLPLVVEPGARFLYGYSTDLLGLILERLEDDSLEQIMRRRLFEPVGLASSGFRAAPGEPAAMPQAFEHDQAWTRFGSAFEAAEATALASNAAHDAGGPMISGGGGLISTIDDVSRFARLLANRGQIDDQRLLSEAVFSSMVSNHLPDAVEGPAGFIGGGWGFGLGGAVRLDSGAAAVPAQAGEYTWSGVTGQSLFVHPETGWFAVMLSSNTASRVIVRLEFRRAVSRI